MIGAWLVSAAMAQVPPGWMRVGRPIRGAAALVSLEVVGFEGGRFEDPTGAALPTERWIESVDLDAVADQAWAALHEAAKVRGITLTDAPAKGFRTKEPVGRPISFASRPWVKGVPLAIQPLLQPAPEVESVLVLRVFVGWCADPNGQDPRGVLCVRAPETALGTGPHGVVGYVFRGRTHALGRRLRSARPTLVAKEVGYAARPDSAAGDPPVYGSGDSWQSQAEGAAARAATLWMQAAAKRKR